MLQLQRMDEAENLGTYRCFVNNNRGNDSIQLTVAEARITMDVFRLGSPALINCSDTRGTGDATLNNVLEWLNGTEDVVSMATNASVLEMGFEAADFAVNNTVFSCRVTDHVTSSVTIRVLGETLSCLSHVTFSPSFLLPPALSPLLLLCPPYPFLLISFLFLSVNLPPSLLSPLSPSILFFLISLSPPNRWT